GGSRHETSAGTAGPSVGEVRTVFVPQAGTAPQEAVAPPPFRFNLADWLPDGITINVSDFFSKTEGCSTIDCVRQSLGKICQNGTLAGCLRSAGLICSEKSTNPNCMTVIAAP